MSGDGATLMRVQALVGITLALLLVAAQSPSDEAATRLSAAAAVQGTTRARLGVLGDAFTCPDARFVSFRRSDAEPAIVDQWYVASQLWADALLLALRTSPTR